MRTDIHAKLELAKILMIRHGKSYASAFNEADKFLDLAARYYDTEDAEKAEKTDRRALYKRRQAALIPTLGSAGRHSGRQPGESIADFVRRKMAEVSASVDVMTIEEVRKELRD